MREEVLSVQGEGAPQLEVEGLQGRCSGPGRACARWALQASLPWPRAPLRFVAVIGVAHPICCSEAS